MFSSKEYTSVYGKLSLLREVTISQANFAIEAHSYIRWSEAEMTNRIVNEILSNEFGEMDALMKREKASSCDLEVEDIAKFPEFPEYQVMFRLPEDIDYEHSDEGVITDTDELEIPF